MTVGETLFTDHAANGGFPEPLDGEPVRVVAARHSSCGQATRVRIPGALPARAVRRVRCVSCAQEFEADAVEEVTDAPASPPRRPFFAGLSMPSFHLPEISLPDLDPSSRGWRLLSIPAAAALVIGGLLVIQDDGDEWGPQSVDAAASTSGPILEEPVPPATTPAPPVGDGGGAALTPIGDGPAEHTELVQGSRWHLVLPEGWERVKPPEGATFAAVSGDGAAEATLWVREDPELDFLTFVERSREQLQTLTGAPPRTAEEIFAPTLEGNKVVLAANSVPDAPSYETVLRGTGPLRFALAMTVRPDASRETLSGAELVAGSFNPEAAR